MIRIYNIINFDYLHHSRILVIIGKFIIKLFYKLKKISFTILVDIS